MITSTKARVAVTAVAVTAAALLAAPAAARADDTCSISWVGGSGTWSDATRWSPARVPTANDSVCIVRATGAAPVSVRVQAATDTDSVTVRSATVSISPNTFLEVTQLYADHAAFTGGGTISGRSGIQEFHDSRLNGVRLGSGGRVVLGGQITFTGGASIDSFSQDDLLDGLRVVDGDGNGANRIHFSGPALYLTGSVFVGVGLSLTDTTLLAQGDVVLTHLLNLDTSGALTPTYRSNLQIGAVGTGSLTLARTITSIGRGVQVFGGDVRTPDGGDAIAAVNRVDGTLLMSRTLFANGPISVGGYLNGGPTLYAPSVTIRENGIFYGSGVTGAFLCAGTCNLAGAHLGRLSVAAGARVTTDLTAPITVDGAATLAGQLQVYSGRPPAGGAPQVLLTAGKGVTGRFGTVVSARPGWDVTPRYFPTYVTGSVARAA